MRTFVTEIASYARSFNPDFLVIPQNGIELTTSNGDFKSPVSTQFLSKINGWGQEDLFYGSVRDDVATKASDQKQCYNIGHRLLFY